MSWRRLSDQKLQQRLQSRARIIQLIREFFVKEGFLEVETPILVSAAGQEPHLNPLKTKMWDERGAMHDAYLITSPEYAHKKLLAAGFEKTFEITRAFRAGEQWGGLHNPEFAMLEWYRAHADYRAIMDDVEKMVQYVKSQITPAGPRVLGKAGTNHKSQENSESKYSIPNIDYQGKNVDLSSPWQRMTMQEAWKKHADVDVPSISDRKYLVQIAKERGYNVRQADTYDDLFFKIFLTEIEPKLGQGKPTILYEYPAQMASLARLKPPLNLPLAKGEKEGVYAERFEVYIAGMELGNAFSELTDANEQRRRFMEEQKLRRKLGKEIIPLDEDFLDAVGHMPPSAGIAFGVDRLVMLLTDAKSIEDVLAFPATELWRLDKSNGE